MRTWIDAWQMQCCGVPFGVAGTVELVTSSEVDLDWLEAALGPDVARSVDCSDERHDANPASVRLTGVVRQIEAAWCEYGPSGRNGVLYPVPGSTQLSAVDRADGWTPDQGEARFIGYLVLVDATEA